MLLHCHIDAVIGMQVSMQVLVGILRRVSAAVESHSTEMS